MIVGLDNDESIRRSKGNYRPIHKLQERLFVLSELESVDYVFGIRNVIDFGTSGAGEAYAKITKLLKPNYLITYPIADKFWNEKRERAAQAGAKLLIHRPKRRSSTTLIVEKLSKES